VASRRSTAPFRILYRPFAQQLCLGDCSEWGFVQFKARGQWPVLIDEGIDLPFGSSKAQMLEQMHQIIVSVLHGRFSGEPERPMRVGAA
jgi:hypothetical protein